MQRKGTRRRKSIVHAPLRTTGPHRPTLYRSWPDNYPGCSHRNGRQLGQYVALQRTNDKRWETEGPQVCERWQQAEEEQGLPCHRKAKALLTRRYLGTDRNETTTRKIPGCCRKPLSAGPRLLRHPCFEHQVLDAHVGQRSSRGATCNIHVYGQQSYLLSKAP